MKDYTGDTTHNINRYDIKYFNSNDSAVSTKSFREDVNSKWEKYSENLIKFDSHCREMLVQDYSYEDDEMTNHHRWAITYKQPVSIYRPYSNYRKVKSGQSYYYNALGQSMNKMNLKNTEGILFDRRTQ